MDMALRLAAADGQEPRLDWLGQEIRPEATGGTVILITAEDDADELAIRWNDIDPTGEMRQRAAGRLIAIPMDNIGGAFAFVSQDPRSREMLPSAQWARLMSAISGIRDRGGRSEERRVGKECVSTGRSRGSPYHKKKKTQKS